MPEQYRTPLVLIYFASMALTRAKIALMLGLFVATGAGLAMLPMASPPPAGEKPESAKPPIQEAKQPRLDRFGDPLPEGAMARLGTMRFRHGNGLSVAFAADGPSLLTVGGDRALRTWDRASGRLLRPQQFPGGATSLAILSPDRRLVVFEELPASLALWDVRSSKLRHKLALERQFPHVIFSPDSKWLVTGEEDGTLRVWDTATGKGRLLGRHNKEIHGLAFTHAGVLMSQSADQTLRFWNVDEGRERSRLTLAESLPQSPHAAVAPDGRVLAVPSCRDDQVRFWDAATGKPAKDWIAASVKGRRSIQFSPDGKTVLIGTKDGGVLWDPRAGKRIRSLSGDSGFGFTFSADGKSVASLGLATGGPFVIRESMVRVWDLTTGRSHQANQPERGHLAEVDELAFAPDGRTIASASSCQEDQSVRLWDCATGRLLRSLPVREGIISHGLTFTPDGKDLLFSIPSAVMRREVATGREVRRYRLDEKDKNAQHTMGMHLCDDGRTLLAFSQNQTEKFTLHAWNADSGEHLRSAPLAVDEMWIGYSRFSPDGRLLATPSGSIRDTVSGAELARVSAAAKSLSPVAFSADGALLALGVEEEVKEETFPSIQVVAVQIWETATLSPVARLATGQVAHVAFTPDGRRLIAAGPHDLKLWDIASRQVVARRPVPGRSQGSRGPSFASSLALAPNGRNVATGQMDTTVLLWDLSPPLPDRPPAPLTVAQRETYWNDLAGVDAGRAFAAGARLADSPTRTVGMLRERLKPAKTPSAEELRRLLADLDHEKFERREAASKRLTELGELAESALREKLRDKPALEVRHRIEGLLAEPPLSRTPDERRHLRAVRVLEAIGNTEARQVLETLAKGVADARLTREAKAALKRLSSRDCFPDR